MAKRFKSVFILDVSKLSRILNVVEERFKTLDKSVISTFEITTQKGKNISAANVESILEHDNAINNSIISLVIKFKDLKDEPLNICHIHYDKEDSDVIVRIKCENSKWGNDLFAELEEQIERSFVHNFIYSLKKQKIHEFSSMLLAIMTISIMSFSIFSTAYDEKEKLYNNLTYSEIQNLIDSSKNIKDRNDKVEFLYTIQQKQLINISQGAVSKNGIDFKKIKNYFNLKMAFVILAILIVVFGIVYLLKYCYPGSIFLWGDYQDYYSSIIDKRKFLWNTVIIALLLGVITNLFVFSFSQYL